MHSPDSRAIYFIKTAWTDQASFWIQDCIYASESLSELCCPRHVRIVLLYKHVGNMFAGVSTGGSQEASGGWLLGLNPVPWSQYAFS